MKRKPPSLVLATLLVLVAAQGVAAQSAAPTPAAPASGKARKPHHGKPPSTAMDVGDAQAGGQPTGPYTNTDDGPPVSDLSGSTGPGVTTPAAPPPPGVAPPGGAPDTGGAETPNTAGGPHR